MGGGILKNTAVVAVLTACSRVLGLVREMFQSRLIGAGVEQSAFAVAFAIPNMARRMFGEGALTAAFVPVFKDALAADAALKQAQRLARAVMTMSLLVRVRRCSAGRPASNIRRLGQRFVTRISSTFPFSRSAAPHGSR